MSPNRLPCWRKIRSANLLPVHNSRSAVLGARVNVDNEATGVERQTVSADSGTITVTNLPFYTVTVEGKGFKRFQTSKNKLDASVPRGSTSRSRSEG